LATVTVGQVRINKGLLFPLSPSYSTGTRGTSSAEIDHVV